MTKSIMESQKILSACLLLLVMTVSAQDTKVKVKSVMNGIEVNCPNGKILYKDDTNVSPKLEYKDENSGEYNCNGDQKILIKFRTCDNCVDLDLASIIGIVIGNVVATIVIGVGIYLTTAHNRVGSGASNKKGSDRQHLVPNEVNNRAPNDHYQQLKPKSGQKDMYDVLTNRR